MYLKLDSYSYSDYLLLNVDSQMGTAIKKEKQNTT